MLFIFLFTFFKVPAQNSTLDSLLAELKRLQHGPADISVDTSYINACFSIADEYYHAEMQEEEEFYTNKGLHKIDSLLSKEISDEVLNVWLIHKQGIGYGNKGNYYSDIGDLPQSLDYYFKALRNDEKINHIEGMERHLGNIAIVYDDLGDHQKSLNYYFRALKYAHLRKMKSSEAGLYGNIATAYMDLHDNKRALSYCSKAVGLFEELKDTSGIAYVFGNIGLIYKDLGDERADAGTDVKDVPEYYTAVTYFKKAIELNVLSGGEKSTEAINKGSLGSVFMSMKKYTDAEKYLKESLDISKKINDLYGVMSTTEHLGELYAEMARQKGISQSEQIRLLQLANSEMQEHMLAKDSIFNQDKTSDITRKEMNYEYEKKEAITKAIAVAEKRTQHIIIGCVIGGLILSLIFLLFIFRSLRLTKKQKIMIELQKREVEEHRKGIIDSITYARRIQEALLKEEEHVTAHLPEHFVLYKPKDIVSGDFYWSVEKKGYWFICVADCTGHGVPGAFMSMLGIAYLNEIISSDQILTPADILNRLREKIVKELKQTGESGESQDGMDISMIRFHKESGETCWAGANNPLWISEIKGGIRMIKEVEPDKQPIGYTFNPEPFTDHILSIKQDDIVYLFSDGYADQFGGPKGKKFKSKNLQAELLRICNEPLNNQKEILDSVFEEWRGSLEQLDDVAIIGIRM
ncbi:MAG: protein serine/threonine phosphatase [Bacteroidota bacterium]|nr:protein serine/threonine phosphatase [Bacteroidota bacterium]